MTEDQAKTKWCPFARLLYSKGEVGFNRHSETPAAGSRCIASACMAWRWSPETAAERMARTGSPDRPGFCGLAGAPT